MTRKKGEGVLALLYIDRYIDHTKAKQTTPAAALEKGGQMPVSIFSLSVRVFVFVCACVRVRLRTPLVVAFRVFPFQPPLLVFP